MMRRIFVDQEREDLFRKQGYIVQPFLSEQEVEEVKGFYYANAPQELPGEFHATMAINDAKYRKKIDKKIKDISNDKAQSFLSDYRILFSNFIIKEPGDNSDVGVHQDWSYMNDDEGTSVNIWVPLVDTDEVNGCLHLLPRSHVFNKHVRYTPFEGVDGKEVAIENAIPLRLKKGEAIIYHSAIYHFSEINHSARTRPAFGMVCIPREAHSYHYFKTNENGQNKIEVYRVDADFYLHHVLNQKPSGYPKVRELAVPPKIDLRQQWIKNATNNEHANNGNGYNAKRKDQLMDKYTKNKKATSHPYKKGLLDYLKKLSHFKMG